MHNSTHAKIHDKKVKNPFLCIVSHENQGKQKYDPNTHTSAFMIQERITDISPHNTTTNHENL